MALPRFLRLIYSRILPSMVLHNPNNWHWVNKDVREWARQYLEKSLVGTSAEQGDVSATVSKIISMDGDVDVSQRKGKVITLFDVKLQMEYEGNGTFNEHLGRMLICHRLGQG